MRRIRLLMTIYQWITLSFVMACIGGTEETSPGIRPDNAPPALPLCSSIAYSDGSDLVPSPVYEVDRTLFLVYSPQIWRSQDNGVSWQVIYRAPGMNGKLRGFALTHAPISPDVNSDVNFDVNFDVNSDVNFDVNSDVNSDVNFYVRHWYYQLNRRIYGIARSTDAGIRWEERTACDPNCQGIYATNRPETIFAVRAEPLFPTESGLGILRSDDGGLSWQTVWEESNAFHLYVSPTFAEDGTLFGVADGMIRSSDGGLSWQRPQGEPGAGYLVAFSPDFAYDLTLFTIRQQALFKSQDGGQSWFLVYTFGGEANPIDMEVSPDYAEDHTLFVLTHNTLFVSYNDGVNWSVMITGLTEPDLDVRRLTVSTSEYSRRRIELALNSVALSHRLYLPFAGTAETRYRPFSLVLSDLAERNTYYYSDDGGLTWNCLNPPPVF